MKDFREKTVSGILWSAGSQAGRQVAVLASNVILARLLTPADFGVIATAIIFSNFAFVIAEQGLSLALIQREDVTEAHLSSIFWVNLAVGALLAAAFLAGAPALGAWYREPALTAVARLIASMFLIYPLGLIHKVVLTRRLAFRAIAAVEIGAAWAAGAAAVFLAWRGMGVTSIALQFVVESAVSAAALWALCDWRPRFLFSLRAVRDLIGFSANVFADTVFSYWVRNVDNLLIGLYWGTFQLGLYSRAYAVMLFPLSRVTWVFSRVMIRSFSLIRGDAPRVRAVFLKMNRVVALITVPMMLGVAASATPFVACVFGRQWLEMVPVLRLLALVGMVQSLTSALTPIYLSHDETKLGLRVGVISQSLQVLGIVAGLKWGIRGVACGYALASVFAEPYNCRRGIGIIGLRLRDFVANVAGILACGTAMALAVAALDAALSAWPALARMALDAAVGAVLYWGLLRVFSIPGYDELAALARERLGGLGVKPA